MPFTSSTARAAAIKGAKKHFRPFAQRLWEKIDKCGQDECWPWKTTSSTQFGYGIISRNRRAAVAHRCVWEDTNGKIPDGMNVLHKCDNPKCCNPAHLFLGTKMDNTKDMMKKGRNKAFKGEQHPKAIISESDVIKMKELSRQGVPYSSIAAAFGISKATAGHAIVGRNWKHVHYATLLR